ncbi:hypothetical protein ACOSQ4_019584 [Xanthoceras sorbifolium]
MREHDTEKGRYNLNLRANRKHLITELTTNDRSWKNRYFFARGFLIEWPIGDSVVPNIGAPQAIVGLTCATRIAKILSYDMKKRSWKSILSEENLRPSHLWNFSVINDRGKVVLDISSTGKKRRKEDLAAGGDTSVDLIFPQDASASSDVGSILPQVEQLRLPEDKSRFKEMGLSQAADWGFGHLFQLDLALKKVRELKSSNQHLKLDNEKLKASSLEAKKTTHEASSRAVEATLELNKLKSNVGLLEVRLKAKELDYDSLYDKAEDNVLNAIIKTRADLMREYRDGRATEWKVERWIVDHKELTRLDDEEDGDEQVEAKDAEDKAGGEEPVLPPLEGSTIVTLAAQPSGKLDGVAP